MKKLFALLLVSSFAFAFAACGGKTENAGGADSTATEAPAVEAAPAAPADSTASDSTAAK